MKVEDRHTGKMMLLHGMNDNIIISHLYYSGVYQDKPKKMRYIKRDK